jgi:Ser-tRNA(Ala) deacylase AlaX
MTKQIYYLEPYKTETEAFISEVQENTGSMLKNVILDQTVFYPEGGGQPGDRGEIVGKDGIFKVEYTRMIKGEITHQGKTHGVLGNGEKIKAIIDWNFRYKYMRIHSAGHLIHDVLMSLVSSLKPLKGSHSSKAYLEYEGSMDVSLKDKLADLVKEAVGKDLPIITREASYEELVKECQFVPSNLPKDKSLRMIKIGDFKPMPDGGVQVKSTKEIGLVLITDIILQEGKTIIKYRVVGPA